MAKKLGLALGSGASLGFSHIGVLRALEESKIPIECIAGSSIGAMIGGHYCLYKDIDLLETVGMEFVKEKPFKLFDWQSIADRATKERRIKLFMEEHFRDKTFSNTKIPFVAVTADLETGEEVDISRGRLLDAIFASASVPGVFGPAFFWGKWLIDGGVVNPTPVSVLQDKCDFVLGISLTKKICDSLDKKPSPIATIGRALDIMIEKIDKFKMYETEKKMILMPKFKETKDTFNTKMASEYIAAGYNTMKEHIPELKIILEIPEELPKYEEKKVD